MTNSWQKPGPQWVVTLALVASFGGGAASCRSRAPDDAAAFLALLEIAAEPDRLSSPDGFARLEAALVADPGHLSLRERVVLQNDLWGSAQRLLASGNPSAAPRLCERLAWRLAPEAGQLAALEGLTRPAALGAMLPEADGFVEHSSEHRVLSHERAFGLRRAFRLMIGEQRRALVGQLVAFDREGRVHLTNIVSDVERLEFRGEQLVAAQVLHLDRRSGQLEEVELLSQIPSHGATSSIIDFSPPERVSDLPCFRCHHDRQMMSLPTLDEDPKERLRRLLASAVVPQN